MITSCASNDSEYKAIISAAGNVVHAFCGDTAQNSTWRSDPLGLIDMDEDEQDIPADLKSIDAIAKDSLSERNKKNVKDLTEFLNVKECQRIL